MQAASVGIQGQSGAQVATGYDAFQEIGISDFLNLMIAELQNQDPLNPVDNSEMLAQIGQMRQIAANDKLTSTLESVLLGQNVATASSLIGRLVEGLTEDSQKIIGRVDAVTVNDGEPQLLVSGKRIRLDNVVQIIDEELIVSDDPTAPGDAAGEDTDTTTENDTTTEGE